MFDNSPAGIEAYNDEMGAFGDARKCPRHPGVRTSSDDGMFDGVCGICEAEMAEAAARWDVDPENPRRSQCGNEVYIAMPWREGPFGKPGYLASCNDSDDEIPF